ncbi:MAG TPA: VOC family protein [Solirubrobacterales bacterium]|jgi:predicted enzyme related to lactoylglutathione lyase
MSERTSYAPGTPCWADLGTPDIDGAASFYGGLFGWSIPEGENSEQTGGYRQAMLRGKPVAGAMPLMQEGQPPAWSTYISVGDAEATAAKVREAGGTVIAEPMDVMELGRMAVFADPTGAVFGIWQPGAFVGAEVVNEAGAIVWNELNTRDIEGARAFYGAVFGWGFTEREFETGSYTTIKAGEDTVGGMIDISGRVPDEVPAHWLVYFAVDDTDATIEKAKGSGGEAVFGPEDISEVGRIAVLKDPFGAVLALIKPNPAMGAGS